MAAGSASLAFRRPAGSRLSGVQQPLQRVLRGMALLDRAVRAGRGTVPDRAARVVLADRTYVELLGIRCGGRRDYRSVDWHRELIHSLRDYDLANRDHATGARRGSGDWC